MADLPTTVDDDMVVSLAYVLKLDSGEEVDRSEAGEPLQFLQGHGQIISGLEDALYGMEVGSEQDVVVSPEEGYGEHDPEGVETMPRSAFPPNLELTPGLGLQLRDQESGAVYQAYVVEVRDDDVVLDFNHPLAGETLHFHVKVVGLRQATDEELTHGHAHTDGHSH